MPDPGRTPDPPAVSPLTPGGHDRSSESRRPPFASLRPASQHTDITVKENDDDDDDATMVDADSATIDHDDGDSRLLKLQDEEGYYFAYGMDFDPAKMKKVVPEAVHMGLARLDGYRWLLCGPPRSNRKCTSCFPLTISFLDPPSPPGLVSSPLPYPKIGISEIRPGRSRAGEDAPWLQERSPMGSRHPGRNPQGRPLPGPAHDLSIPPFGLCSMGRDDPGNQAGDPLSRPVKRSLRPSLRRLCRFSGTLR